jgi:predicted RNA binding protein YcfA (HicA-like mRNA interferase family)
MRASEFITEHNLEEGISKLTVRDAKRALTAMGFEPTGRHRGSHNIWKDLQGVLFTLPIHGKEIDYGVTQNLLRIMRERGIKLPESTNE